MTERRSRQNTESETPQSIIEVVQIDGLVSEYWTATEILSNESCQVHVKQFHVLFWPGLLLQELSSIRLANILVCDVRATCMIS